MAFRALVWLGGALTLLGTLYGFQRPFREYPGVEYRLGSIPLPPDWQDRTEWTFARLMYPQAPGAGIVFTAVVCGTKAAASGPRTTREPTVISRRPFVA
ncbi:MAG: hypothetical protein WDO73_24150 [Ignavibacteriota bacterium]